MKWPIRRVIDQLKQHQITLELSPQGRILVYRPEGQLQDLPHIVQMLLLQVRERQDEVKAYLQQPVLLAEVVSLRGGRMRVYQARPACVAANRCLRAGIGCSLSPETTEFGWTKRCREKAPVKKAETPRTKARGEGRSDRSC